LNEAHVTDTYGLLGLHLTGALIGALQPSTALVVEDALCQPTADKEERDNH
jgi:hypothetical protein